MATARKLLCQAMLATAAMRLHAEVYTPATNTVPPPPLREFRGVWVATVDNKNWPSKPGAGTREQKGELLAILDRAEQLKLNAVILQVRPECDALYSSSLEPWSEYLTGRMGQAPQPFYDPLAFAIEEAHRRGLELHAWFNPYRALDRSSKSPVATNHITRTRPDLVRKYGDYLWLDPGERDVPDHVLAVVMDVVKRYDVDGIHFDDYFYLERRDANATSDFPDDPSWKRYGLASGLGRDDWRRRNVNQFIERTYAAIKTAKPWVKFGISPFGIWRPGQPPSIQGKDAYAVRYGDSRKWLSEGWVDYLAPQLYWPVAVKAQSFPVLLQWWGEQNRKGRHLWPGLFSSRWPPDEIAEQIQITRRQAGVAGHILYNFQSLTGSNGLDRVLQRSLYAQPALVPATPWLGRTVPGKPNGSAGTVPGGALQLQIRPAEGDPVWLRVLQTRSEGKWTTEILPARTTSRDFGSLRPEVIAVTPVDRCGNAGPPVVLQKEPDVREPPRPRKGVPPKS